MSDRRLAWVDWLRILALLAVFVVHICEVFNPWIEWHISNPQHSIVAGEILIVLASWIMPLFMLLAGTSAWYSLQSRSNARYVRERVTRILLPLLAGIVVLVPPQIWAERRLKGQFTGSLLAFYPHMLDGGLYPKGNISWHHLWFLAHLFVYSVVAIPVFRYLFSDRGRARLHTAIQWCGGRFGFLWLVVPLIVERQLAWWPFARYGLWVTDWSSQSILFIAYVYGFMLAAEPEFGRNIDRQWPYALGLALLNTLTMCGLALVNVFPARVFSATLPGSLAFWAIYTVGAWSWVVAAIGIGRRYLTRETSVVAFGRRVGLNWYLLHQTVIVVVAAQVVTWTAGIGEKAAVIASVSFVVTTLGAMLMSAVSARGGTVARRSTTSPEVAAY